MRACVTKKGGTGIPTDSPFAVGLAGLLPAIPVGHDEEQDGADEDERG